MKTNSRSSWPNITIVNRNGVPTVHRDGKPWLGWGGVRPIDGDHYEIYGRLAGVGLRQFQAEATCAEDIYHPQLRFWHGPGQFDGKVQHEHFQKIADLVAPDALLQLRLYVGAPPWWLDLHPDHCQVFADGHVEHEVQRGGKRPLPSFASSLWKAEACQAFQAYIEWLVESGWSRRISTIFICSGITWESGLLGSDDFLDYSEHGQRYFRQWVREKYGTEDRLSAAWGRKMNFESVAVPPAEKRNLPGGEKGLRVIPEEQDVIDHQLSLSDMNADFLLALAETAKKASDNQLIVGTFYGYTLTAREHSKFMGQYGAGGFQGGHHAMGRVLRSPHFDMIGSPFNYCDRSLGTGLIFEHTALASIHRHGKVFFEENDLWAWNNPPHFEAKTLSVGYTPTLEQTLLLYQVAFMQTLVRGKHQWMVELTDWIGPYQENFSDPQLLAEIKRLNVLGEELIQLNRAQQTEIAFVLDEKSVACLRLDNKEFLEKIYKGSVAWGHLGAPFDLLLLDDLLEKSPYKLVVAAFIKDPAALKQFEDWAARNPKIRIVRDLSAPLAKEIELAGVHRYVEEPVTVWANATMVGVHVDRPGPRRVRFRSPTKGVEAISGKEFAAPEGEVVWNFVEKGVALFVARK
jgi:hypothetical protein